MERFPRGSEWRKWDLHTHIPGTHLSNGYGPSNSDNWDTFADDLEASDVAVIGLTDYFDVGLVLEFIDHFRARHPDSKKLLLVNLEVRLNEAVNRAGELVHYHVIFNPELPSQKITEFTGHLATQLVDVSGRAKRCGELSANDDFLSATVTRQDLNAAFQATFGTGIDRREKVIFLAPANNDGLRAETGNLRKANISDLIDRDSDAFFGHAGNAAYFLSRTRYEDGAVASTPKPVFSGSDAHSFDDLHERLGQHVINIDNPRDITWVKADPTYEGLLQTLIEPDQRVALQPVQPDAKDDFKVIKSVRFAGSNDFPAEIQLNPNMNSIIGSRSSGKSALLAHVAYAVDPDYTIAQQMLATGKKDHEVGPAASISWSQAAATTCTIEWADGNATSGAVIYVPQNWLFQISENPDEVTAKIGPVLERNHAALFAAYERVERVAGEAEAAIVEHVGAWVRVTDELDLNAKTRREIGDRASLERTRSDLQAEIESVREQYQLAADDLAAYQQVINELRDLRDRRRQIEGELETLAGIADSAPTQPIEARLNLTPSIETFPDDLRAKLQALIDSAEGTVSEEAQSIASGYWVQITEELEVNKAAAKQLADDNADLIERYRANKSLEGLVARLKDQEEALADLTRLENDAVALVLERDEALAGLSHTITARGVAIAAFTAQFAENAPSVDDLVFGAEAELPAGLKRAVSEPFNKVDRGDFIDANADEVFIDVAKAQDDPGAFLSAVALGDLRLNRGNEFAPAVAGILMASPEVRFTATLDGDKIGGFERSSMTPGKQALFALTLILNEADDGWPLLLDQPEDDLDSRSIYDTIVPYLKDRKRERQIILVSHNANLVVGSDTEEVVVANRHGTDSPNEAARTFDYLTGSLEHSQPKTSAGFVLNSMGIREHACEILDGGADAFEKRMYKYRI